MLVFNGPHDVTLLDEPCPTPGAGEVLVRTRLSALSAGTELLAYRGQLPPDMALDETLPGLANAAFQYPFRYGYASMGVVVAAGAGVEAGWTGKRVFAFVPHASAFIASINDVFEVPESLPDEASPLLASAETATNLVLDGCPQLGERVVIFGQGVIGLLLTSILARFPLQSLEVVDPAAPRTARGVAMGATVRDPGTRGSTANDADLSYEVSGNPAALDQAIAVTGSEGRVVVGSFYGQKRASLDLGGHFHRGRLRLISSQVSHIGSRLRGRWDRQRRMAVAWQALGQTDTRALISHRFAFAHAAAAYRLLDQGAPTTLQVLLVHD